MVRKRRKNVFEDHEGLSTKTISKVYTYLVDSETQSDTISGVARECHMMWPKAGSTLELLEKLGKVGKKKEGNRVEYYLI